MKRSSLITVIIIILILGGLGTWIMLVPHPSSNSGPKLSSTGTSTAALAEDASTTPPCTECLVMTTRDNHQTISLSPTSRITIELPSAHYVSSTLIITPSSSMGETFGASAQSGDWVRTFEALATGVGTTTVSVPSMDSSTPAYSLTLRIVDSNNTWQNGMRTITAANNGDTIYLPLHERFLIQFGDALSWNLSFTPSSSITRVPNTTTAQGFQGVYETNDAGTVVLHAQGRPICKPDEMCAQFILEDTITFIVQ